MKIYVRIDHCNQVAWSRVAPREPRPIRLLVVGVARVGAHFMRNYARPTLCSVPYFSHAAATTDELCCVGHLFCGVGAHIGVLVLPPTFSATLPRVFNRGLSSPGSQWRSPKADC